MEKQDCHLSDSHSSHWMWQLPNLEEQIEASPSDESTNNPSDIYACHLNIRFQIYELIENKWYVINRSIKETMTHMVIVVTLPRRNDPFLKLLLVGDCRGEELLQRWDRPPQNYIFHV